MNLKDNTIFITGGTSGIGLAFAEAFLAKGNKVIICARREDRLKQLKEKYPDIIIKQCDISDEAQRREIAEWVIVNHHEINILINNAGIQLATNLTKPVDIAKIRAELEINFIAPLHLASLFAPQLSCKSEAAIINITSGLAFVPIAFMPVYCATKAALHSLTMSLRHQLKGTSVKVFEIAPPSVDTELGHDRREDKTESHGGIPVNEFLEEAMQAISTDLLEAPIGMAKGLRAKREEVFEQMNSH
jgi:uncharacterized oxidoreductase